MKVLARIALSTLLLLFAVSVPALSTAHAADIVGNEICAPNSSGETPAICKDDQTAAADDQNPLFGPNGVITKGVGIFAIVLGIVSVFVFLINAVRMITASGDAQSISGARNGIIYAIIGIVIALSAQLIVSLILRKL